MTTALKVGPKEYDAVYRDGERLDRRTLVAVRQTEMVRDVVFTCFQGSYQPILPASALTHTKGGVGDFWLPGIGDNSFSHSITRSLRSNSFGAVWLRGPLPQYGNFSGWHWHFCDIGDDFLHPEAQDQVANYRAGGNGLVPLITGDDTEDFRPDPIKGFNWDLWLRQLTMTQRLREAQHDFKVAAARLDKTRQREAQVQKALLLIQQKQKGH